MRLNTTLLLLFILVVGCGVGSDKQSSTYEIDSGKSSDDPSQDFIGLCKDLRCQQTKCSSGGDTTVTGVVFDPAGVTPLYNVIVYIPNKLVEPIKTGASCNTCSVGVSGDPITSTITDAHGRFLLKNVPVGTNISLVMQIGKWRRIVKIPKVNACSNTNVSPSITRLPRDKKEGDIPQIAVATGGCDALECLLRKIGIADSEFTNELGSGRIHLYKGKGGGGTLTSSNATSLWSTKESLIKYDAVVMACECDSNSGTKPPEALQRMQDYANAGGRIFGSHFHYYWLQNGPLPWPTTASWSLGGGIPDPLIGTIDTSFPKGAAFAEWLHGTGGSPTLGQIELHDTRHDVDTVNNPPSQRWIYSAYPDSIQYFTFNTPIEATPSEQCGRVIFSDLHVASSDATGSLFPTGCTSTVLSPQEKALEFMLFDLTSCVLPDTEAPTSPIK